MPSLAHSAESADKPPISEKERARREKIAASKRGKPRPDLAERNRSEAMRSRPRTHTAEGLARLAQVKTKHGHARNRPARRGGTNVYYVWAAMIQRCTNPADKGFARYGGRGITVCERWRDFRGFLADMGEPGTGPEGERMTLDRIDPAGNYEPGNCRWATYAVQAANRGVVKLTEDDVRAIRARPYLPVRAVVEKYGIAVSTVEGVRNGRSWRSVQ